MFYDQSEPGEGELDGLATSRSLPGEDFMGFGESVILAPPNSMTGSLFGELGESDRIEEGSSFQRGLYERELIQNVWDFAEIVPGTDPALWRKDEYGDWICRLDYGRRASEFGWEIFDPGIGRHAQGVYAMRPMQWESYIRQYESFA